MLSVGDKAPLIDLPDQFGTACALRSQIGRRTMIFFYPKASTPGCTQQACLLRDLAPQLDDTDIVGISPDKPSAQLKFDQRHSLGFPLLCDIDHAVAEAFGVWKLKQLYGKSYMGVERSAFLISADGRIEQAWYKISPKDTPVKLVQALAQ